MAQQDIRVRDRPWPGNHNLYSVPEDLQDVQGRALVSVSNVLPPAWYSARVTPIGQDQAAR
eukprot:CAMPEP_0117545286 /NCGR_PEP_ID=MMETSP0784-20121206/46016_1 /TAXON_ID=39447 /ORGANISM="" /LENGTH=60 /DNA_ID=CAMNT_0005342127 /DNA_START=78 /DNA_END=257 /DNA_ORIENTATION=-